MKYLGVLILILSLNACTTTAPTHEELLQKVETKENVSAKEKSVLIVTERVFNYAPNSAELSSKDKAELLKIAKQFVSDPEKYRRIEIIGHSDQTGSEDIKVDISKERALAVLELMRQAGIDRKRIRTSWLAGTQPVEDAKDSSLNRRVEVRLFEYKQ